MAGSNDRKAWLDQEGQYQTMRGKACRDCQTYYRVNKRCATVIKVLHKCGLTHEKVNPDMSACVMFPIEAGWKRVVL
jgi:hypothetical protein